MAEVMKRLAEGFATERERLEGQWGRGEDVSTEDLRSRSSATAGSSSACCPPSREPSAAPTICRSASTCPSNALRPSGVSRARSR